MIEEFLFPKRVCQAARTVGLLWPTSYVDCEIKDVSSMESFLFQTQEQIPQKEPF